MTTWGTDRRVQATAHVLTLAARLRTEVHWTDEPEKWQAHHTGQVWVPAPTSPTTYLVALHELGHVASRVARRWWTRYGEPGATTLVEGAAWAWAGMMADPALLDTASEADWSRVGSYFGSYLRDAALVEPPPPGQRVML